MSRNYANYSQYLGSQRCCNLNTLGPVGPQGPAGPAGIGPQGNTGSKGDTGPTGRGCRGPTGPAGGPTGPTGISQWTTRNFGVGLTGYTGIGYTGDVMVFGKLYVEGGIDPTYLALTPQPSGPTGFTNPLWVDNIGNLRSENILLANGTTDLTNSISVTNIIMTDPNAGAPFTATINPSEIVLDRNGNNMFLSFDTMTISDNGVGGSTSTISNSSITIQQLTNTSTLTENELTFVSGSTGPTISNSGPYDFNMNSTSGSINIMASSGACNLNSDNIQLVTSVNNIGLTSATSVNITASDVIGLVSTNDTISLNGALSIFLDSGIYDYQVKTQYASLSLSTSAYIQNGVSARDKGIAYTITGPPSTFNVYYEIKPFFLPYDNCKYRMNISVQLSNYRGGFQDKENQFYFELYDPTAGSAIEGFVFNAAFPYSTAIGIPTSSNSVMNFSFVDYYDLTPFPALINGEVWVRFFGSGNGTKGELRYFVSFDRIEI